MHTYDEQTIPLDYKPSDNEEEYMNYMQLSYFKNKLVSWKDALVQELTEAMEFVRNTNWNIADPTDIASEAVDINIYLKTQDRCRKLLNKIDDALGMIQQGSYGYCQETGEPIGVRRLEARPIATLSIAAQEKHEKFERSHNEE